MICIMCGVVAYKRFFLVRGMTINSLNAFQDVINQFAVARVVVAYYFVKILYRKN